VTSEFAQRVGFTLGALLIYRLGCNIPLPGVKFEVLEMILRTQRPIGMMSLLLPPSGLRHAAIFALGITPYISAAVLVQLAGILSRRLRSLQMQGAAGRLIERRITLCLTVVLAGFQAWGVALALEKINAQGTAESTDILFLISTVITLAGGTIFLAWLSEQIGAFGIGNGIALILLSGTATIFANPIDAIVDGSQHGYLTSNACVGIVVVTIFLTVFVVLMEQARRQFPIDYPERRIGERTFRNLTAVMPIKLNLAGIIPVILAAWMLGVIGTFLDLLDLTGSHYPHWVMTIARQLAPGAPAHLLLYGILIVFCTFFYTAYLFDPEDVAERLRQDGGVIRSIAPGEPTVAHLDRALSWTSAFGAIYLAAICLLPEILMSYARPPFRFGGVSLLILVCTVLDLETQVRGYLRAKPGQTPAPRKTVLRET